MSHAAAALLNTLGSSSTERGTFQNPALMAWVAVSSAAAAVRAAKHKSSSTCLDLNPVEEKTDQTKHIKGGDHTTTKLPD